MQFFLIFLEDFFDVVVGVDANFPFFSDWSIRFTLPFAIDELQLIFFIPPLGAEFFELENFLNEGESTRWLPYFW